jgi:competence protein ComEC
LYLWSDLGWWLSFLAFAGVMMLAPLLQKRLYGKREPQLIGQMVIETVSAEIMTLPLIITMFGSLPLLALPANVLVVPLVPLAMLLTFVAGVAGFVGTFVAPYIALPATWLLTYMTSLVNLFASVPWHETTVSISVGAMLVCYVSFCLVGLLLWRRTKHDYLARSLIE